MTFTPSRLLLNLLTAFALAATAAGAHAAAGVPPGFEDLEAGQDEQVEVQIYGKALGFFSARVKPHSLQFHAPERIASRLGLDQGSNAGLWRDLNNALTLEFKRHGHLMCDRSGASSNPVALGESEDGSILSCNHIETPRAALIFDESRGVAHLFLARDWLDQLPSVASAPTSRYLSVSSKARNALVHRQSLNWASSTGGRRNVTASGVGALGLTQQGHLGGDWSATSRQGRRGNKNQFDLNTLYFRQDFGHSHYAQAGRLDQRNLSSAEGGSFGFTLLPLPRFHGVRLGTTQAYLNPQAADNATDVTVLLTAPARVDIYRQEQLLLTQYLSAGVQRVDTASLPEGSYLLTLKIVENGAIVRQESVPFSKTSGGLDSKHTQWFIQGGEALSDAFSLTAGRNARSGSKRVVQAGVKTGVFDRGVVTVGGAAIGSDVYNETRIDWQSPFLAGQLTSSASFLFGSDGARGNTQSVNYYNGVNLSLYRYSTRQSDRAHSRMTSFGNYDTLSASVAAPLGPWSVSVGYSTSKQVGHARHRSFDKPDWTGDAPIDPWQPAVRQRARRAIQLSASRSFQINGMTLHTRLGGYRSTAGGRGKYDKGIYLGLSLSANAPSSDAGTSRWTSVGVEARQQQGKSGEINYYANQSWSRQNVGTRQLDLGLSGYKDERLSGHVRGMIDGRYGRLDATVDQGYDRSTRRRTGGVSGSFASSVAVGSSGIYFGGVDGGHSPGSAIAVKVQPTDSDTHEAAAQIVSGNRTVVLGFGQQSLVSTLDGYTAQRTSIQDATHADSSGSVALASGAGETEDFLPPGKLVTHEVAANVIYTYLGRVLDSHRRPMSQARVLNVAAAPLDDEGGFVMEMDEPLQVLYLMHQDRFYAARLTVQSKHDVVQVVGEVQAVAIEAADLPSHVRQQPRISQRLAERDQVDAAAS